MTQASSILSDEEVYALTKPVTQGCAQARHLSELLGCPVKRRPDGRPIVTRQMLERLHYESVQARAKEPPPRQPIDLSQFEPPKERKYEDSALQRYHLEQREGRLEREAYYREVDETIARGLAEAEPQRRLDSLEKRAALVRHHAAKRRCEKLKRTPAWTDMRAIRALYVEARRLTATTGIQHHVDHVIPLQGRLVSGLHVPGNLQILTGSENSRKKNTFEVDA